MDEDAGTGRLFIARVHLDDRDAYVATETGPTPDNPTYQTTYRMLCPDGGTVWLEENGHAFFNDKGRMLRIIGIVSDVTKRKVAEKALAGVSRRLIEAQEKERTRIARELHDDIGQRLALLTIELEQLRQNSPNLPAEVRDRFGELQKQAAEIASDVQSMSHQLHSSKLEYLGIATAMSAFCKEFSPAAECKVVFAHDAIPSNGAIRNFTLPFPRLTGSLAQWGQVQRRVALRCGTARRLRMRSISLCAIRDRVLTSKRK